MTTCSSFCSLGTPELGKRVFSSDSQKMHSMQPLYQQLVLTSRSAQLSWTERRSSCRSGTRRARRGSGPSPRPTTGAPWASCWCTTSPTRRGTLFKNWIRNIEEHASADVEKMILGNKCDMNDRRQVSKERGEQLAIEYGIKFMETSAKA